MRGSLPPGDGAAAGILPGSRAVAARRRLLLTWTLRLPDLNGTHMHSFTWDSSYREEREFHLEQTVPPPQTLCECGTSYQAVHAEGVRAE